MNTEATTAECIWKRTNSRGRVPVVDTSCGKKEIAKKTYKYCPHCSLPIKVMEAE